MGSSELHAWQARCAKEGIKVTDEERFVGDADVAAMFNKYKKHLTLDIRWTEPAAAALASIQDYIANDNPRAAFKVTQRIRVAVNQLEAHPNVGRAGRVRGPRQEIGTR